MTDKEKLNFLENYIMDLINSRMNLQFSKGKFGIGLNRFNKVDCAYLEGEIYALDKVRNFIKHINERGEMK